MSIQKIELCETDQDARVCLPSSFANCTLLLELLNESEIVLRKMNAITLDKPHAEPIQIKLSDAGWQKFIEVLDAQPAPNEALKELMREFSPWKESGTFQIEE
jgi:uncharacterized protein (DUF1778 family)